MLKKRTLGVLGAGIICLTIAEPSAFGQVERGQEQMELKDNRVPRVRAVLTPVEVDGGPQPLRGLCPPEMVTHTDADFTGGAFIAQGGFSEGEIAATSYTVDPGAFPLKIESIEMIFATSNATVTTTTFWSILVWEGTPNNGNLVAEYSSDGLILPHLVMPPGTNGTNIFVTVDPDDPEQIIVNDPGNATFSVGYRIDQHNSQTQNPCVVAPPSCCNAFATTDVSGLATTSGNWLFGLNCGPIGCPNNGGWTTFSGLLPGLCRPSGDWVIRASYSPFTCGALSGSCCLDDGNCLDSDDLTCTALGGVFQGENSFCQSTNCPQPTGACCIEATGLCGDFTEASCAAFGGIFNAGTDCNSIICFPAGACCFFDGSCQDELMPGEALPEEDCLAMGGVFQGDGTLCAQTNCPPPTGACCVGAVCAVFTEADCMVVAGVWTIGLDCADADMNQVPDACEASTCDGDIAPPSDGEVNFDDLSLLLGLWGPCPGPSDPCQVANISTGGASATAVDFDDLSLLLGLWGPCP